MSERTVSEKVVSVRTVSVGIVSNCRDTFHKPLLVLGHVLLARFTGNAGPLLLA